MVHRLSLPISPPFSNPLNPPFWTSALTIKVNSFHPARSDTVPFVVGGVLAGLIVVVSCYLHQSSYIQKPFAPVIMFNSSKRFQQSLISNISNPRFWSHILWFGCAGETAWQRTDNRRLCKYICLSSSHWNILGNIQGDFFTGTPLKSMENLG